MTRHQRARWTTTVITVAAVLLLAPGALASQRIPEAAAPREARTAPLNPAFVLWQSMSGLEPVLRAASPHGLGLIPSPVVGYAGKSPSAEGAVGAYPSSYDLRTLGKLTAVRNQGSWGTCWTFGSTGSLESSSLPGETLDLSEDNMALTSGFNVGGATTAAEKYNAGGNADMATAYFVRWGGPVLETDDAYGDSFTPAGLTAKRHVQNVHIWSGRTSATDNDRIKYAVTTFGGADISMLWSDASYNSGTRSYCYTGTGHPNHDVMVVGWNDDYAASNFSPAAAGNGAFIVRNSWGASWGSGGYFYVSYFDTRFGRQYTESGNSYSNDVYTFEAAQPAANYGGIYQYDPLGVTGYRGYGAGVPAWGANVYTATADSMLNAVGVYALAPNTAYEVWEGPTRTSLTRLTSGTLPDMGYHTVAVPSGTTLTGGASFCVAIKLTTPGWSWPIAYESPIANYTSAASAAAGQSYFGSNGTSWTDLTTMTANANVCLKAYASRIPTTASSYSFSPSATSGWKNTAQTVPLTGAAGDGATRMIYYTQDGGTTWGRTLNLSVNMNVADEGAHSIKYYSVDSLASEPVHSPGYVNVDTVKPSTSDNHLSVTPTDPATVTLTPNDATSGVAKTEYKVDGAATYTTGTSVVLHAGSHTVAYRSTDNAGNVETDQTFSATVSATAPTSSTTYATFAADATSGWKTSTQTVTVSASGGDGAARTIHYTQDGGANWSTSTAASVTVPVTTQGAHHFEYYASDSLATETVHDAGWVNIDSVAPATSDDHALGAGLGPTTVTFRPTDATSGMTGGLARTEYKVDGAASYSTGTSVLLAQGTHTVAYRSTDKAGNVESPDKTFTVTVIEPLSPLSQSDYAFAADAVSGWKNTAQQFTITAAGGSGADRTIHYTLDGGATWSTSTAASVDVPVTSEGAHHVQFYVLDSLNGEGPHDGWVNIDTRKPLTKAVKASVRKGRKVTLKFRVTDAMPGCGKAVLRLQIRKQTKVVKTIALGTKGTNAALGCRYTARLRKGTYTWRVLATDIAGNAAATIRSARLVVR
jgi:C1A family cysteine protease